MNEKIKEGKLFKTVEIVIVNDGSKDKTLDIVKDYTTQSTKSIQIRGISQHVNSGKGTAVKYVRSLFSFRMQGSLFSKGKHILFTDADGATNIECLEKVLIGC